MEIICDVLSILERRTLARSFVLLVWLGFGWERLVVGNTIKRTKNGKQILKKSPQPSSRKWTQVCIEFLFIYKYINQINEVFVTSDQIFFLTPTQISRNVYFKDFYFQFNEWLFYNIYVLFAEHLKWFASVRIILDFTSHNWELNVRRDFFFFFTYMYIIYFYPEILRSYCWLYCKKVDFEEKKIIKKERFPISPK